MPYSFIVVNIPLQYCHNNHIASFSVLPNPTYDFTAVSYHIVLIFHYQGALLLYVRIYIGHTLVSVLKSLLYVCMQVSLDYTTFESACMCIHMHAHMSKIDVLYSVRVHLAGHFP